jgi:hypothetical protein
MRGCLVHRRKRRQVPRNKVVVAVARALAGFVWAIAREVKPAAWKNGQ